LEDPANENNKAMEAKCSLCGKVIPRESNLVEAPGKFIPGSPVNVGGIECRFDSEFCDTLFRKLQVVYGAGFCSYLAGTV
jgi:hypothetical protein